MSYKRISKFGQGAANNPVNNPLTYCISRTVGNKFTHGSITDTVSSVNGKHCKAFMAQYCANKWDDVCEYESKNKSRLYPNYIQKCGSDIGVACEGLTTGEILIQNTATYKYLVKMGGSQCSLVHEPFDPTVASSPLVAFWSGGCVPIYAVNPKEIDNDPVMNKILNKPIIAWSLLINIYNTAIRKKILHTLKGTRIHKFFMSKPFQNYLMEMKKTGYKSKSCSCN